MLTNYQDILDKAGDPLWYDENGVPRYIEFHPNKCVMAGAEETFLVEVMCQACGTPFLVALTWRNEDRFMYGAALPPADRLSMPAGNSLHYGDPPNIGCCQPGPTMSTDFNRIVQAWVRSDGIGSTWVRLDQDAINAIGAQSEFEVSGLGHGC